MEVESTTLLCCDCFKNDDPRCNPPQSDVALIAIGVTLGVIGVFVIIFIIWAAKRSGYLVNIRHRQSADPNIYGSFPEKKELPSTSGVENNEPIYDTINHYQPELEVRNPAVEYRNVDVLHLADRASETDSIDLRMSDDNFVITSTLADMTVQQDLTNRASTVPNDFTSSHNRSLYLPVEVKINLTRSLTDLRTINSTKSQKRRHRSFGNFYKDVQPAGLIKGKTDDMKDAMV